MYRLLVSRISTDKLVKNFKRGHTNKTVCKIEAIFIPFLFDVCKIEAIHFIFYLILILNEQADMFCPSAKKSQLTTAGIPKLLKAPLTIPQGKASN
jgi:hypothetical protein